MFEAIYIFRKCLFIRLLLIICLTSSVACNDLNGKGSTLSLQKNVSLKNYGKKTLIQKLTSRGLNIFHLRSGQVIYNGSDTFNGDDAPFLEGKNSDGGVTKRTKMYFICSIIVLAWVTIGTSFYSWFNRWPIPQSFFYAIDAGMSIGFCTEVAEKKVGSRAFTIAYILLGASCVGGALALFVEDILEGITRTGNKEYRKLLEQAAFQKADHNKQGSLSLNEFRELLTDYGYVVNDDYFLRLCRNFDPNNTGLINYEQFEQKYCGIGHMLRQFDLENKSKIQRAVARIQTVISKLFGVDYRIFVVFILWISMGITWGMIDQKWDIITSTHFAISALATGGLTAPPVGDDGILPATSAIFCGLYCLFGIPMFALTVGHFARILVQRHVFSAEKKVIMKPIDINEFEFAKSLCSEDDVMHLSDFIVMQLLRQKKINMETVNVLKSHFKSLDVDKSTTLTLAEATATPVL